MEKLWEVNSSAQVFNPGLSHSPIVRPLSPVVGPDLAEWRLLDCGLNCGPSYVIYISFLQVSATEVDL
jgi:hypothetical protein